jgi:hypothetical protein
MVATTKHYIENLRGQLKIQQMIFMIVAVVFLFVLVGLFFLSISLNKIQKESTNIAEREAITLVSRLANSPEFSCGNAYGSNKPNCIDFDKVMVLKENIAKYSDFWGVAKIEIRKVYPNQGNMSCKEENYPNCGDLKILDKNVEILSYSSTFVSLCRKESSVAGPYSKCELARLMVSSEDKT